MYNIVDNAIETTDRMTIYIHTDSQVLERFDAQQLMVTNAFYLVLAVIEEVKREHYIDDLPSPHNLHAELHYRTRRCRRFYEKRSIYTAVDKLARTSSSGNMRCTKLKIVLQAWQCSMFVKITRVQSPHPFWYSCR